ncbi:hypothetical protein SELMODRAFT_422825 [Selaginella moellendorffii]|uniref:Uncharacterized protein n=1 Tax=Selaginella moellendorffii TaxID=88036 RepID=D8SJN7_SELML|nr:hypothetical protein SELMODRAFT_422825 [Selaginella moellendorffii]
MDLEARNALLESANRSPGLVFGTDEFCCEDEFFRLEKCHPNQFSLLFNYIAATRRLGIVLSGQKVSLKYSEYSLAWQAASVKLPLQQNLGALCGDNSSYKRGGITEAMKSPSSFKLLQLLIFGSGKFWGRPNCQFDTVLGTGCCETGDCSNAIGCNSTYSPPATTVEFKLHRDFIDEYSVSLVEGYNLAVKVSSSNPVCLSGGCSCDLNSRCPSELLVWNSRGTPVACNSPCLAFGADEFCCEDEFLGG